MNYLAQTWPQLCMAGLLLAVFTSQLVRDGKKGGSSTDVTATFVANGVVVGLLYAGGYWNILWEAAR